MTVVKEVVSTLRKYKIAEIASAYAIGASGKDLITSLYADVAIPLYKQMRGEDDPDTKLDWDKFNGFLMAFIFIVIVCITILKNL